MDFWRRIKAAREQQAEIRAQAKTILDKSETEKRDLSGDEQKQFDDLVAKVEAKSVELRQLERQQELQHRSGQPGGPGRHDINAGSRPTEWRDGNGRPVQVLTSEQRVADQFASESPLSFGLAVRGLLTGKWHGAEAEQRALSTGASSGGYLLTGGLSAEVIDKARAMTVCLNAGARTVTWDGSNTLKIARLTTDPTMEVKVENEAFTGSNAAFDALTFTAFTIGTTMDISRELAEDAPNSGDAIADAAAKALAVQLDYLAMFGAGTTEPEGLNSAAGVQEVENVGVLTDYTPFVSAWTKVLTANGNPNAYILAPRDAGDLESLAVSEGGQYLLPPRSIAALSRHITSAIPTNGGFSEDLSTAFLGDFSKMLFGIRQDALIEFSSQAGDSFSKHQVRVKITWRGDIKLAQPSHFVKLTGVGNVS